MQRKKWILAAALAAALMMAWGQVALAGSHQDRKLKSVGQVGRLIELDDGSLWRVLNPEDQEIAYTWLPYQDISVIGGNQLLNEHTGQRIDAQKVQAPGRGRTRAAPSNPSPRPAAPGQGAEQDRGLLKKVLERLEALEAKLQVMDWRLRKLEKEALARP